MSDHDDISRIARQLLQVAPALTDALRERGDDPEPDPEFPMLWLCDAGRAVSRAMPSLTPQQRLSIFELVEARLIDGSDYVKNGVATCFLEALASEVSGGTLDGPFLATLLGPESRAYLDAWDEFTMGYSTLDPPQTGA